MTSNYEQLINDWVNDQMSNLPPTMNVDPLSTIYVEMLVRNTASKFYNDGMEYVMKRLKLK